MKGKVDGLALSVEIGFAEFSLSISEEFAIGQTTSLYGPSGAGKSTLLRIIAGLETQSRGTVRFGGEIWQDSASKIHLPPHERNAVLVFQDSRLFDHMNVVSNLGFGEHRKRGRQGPQRKEIVDALDLGSLQTRSVASLSGGERQRVALGRALLAAPRLLLLDEPLNAVDNVQKILILGRLKALLRQHDIPTIIVSHSYEELSRISASSLEINQGRIVSRRLPDLTDEFQVIHACVAAVHEDRTATVMVGTDRILAQFDTDPEVGDKVLLEINATSLALTHSRQHGVISAGQLKVSLIDVSCRKPDHVYCLTLRSAGGELMLQCAPSLQPDGLLKRGRQLFAVLTRPARIICST